MRIRYIDIGGMGEKWNWESEYAVQSDSFAIDQRQILAKYFNASKLGFPYQLSEN